MSNNVNKVSIRRLRPSPSMIISLFALLVALSTGAYAAVTIAPENSVVSKSIKNENVKTEDLAAQAVTKGKLKKASVNGAEDPRRIRGHQGHRRRPGRPQRHRQRGQDRAQPRRPGLLHALRGWSAIPTTMTTMASLSLPAGAYVLISKAQIDTNIGADIVDCDLVDGLGHKDTELRPMRHTSPRPRSSPTTSSPPTPTAEPRRCSARRSAAAISQARLTAINVSSVTNSPL